MDFKFEWLSDDNKIFENSEVNEESILAESKILSINEGCSDIVDNSQIDKITFNNDISIMIYNPKSVETNLLKNVNLISSSLYDSLNAHKDIESGVYEGGFTLWEGSKNLVQYLIKEEVTFLNKSVLELGSGYGLPGIFSIIKKAAKVCLQDFNLDVLKYCTIPNTLLNTELSMKSEISFISGDWRCVSEKIAANSFDIILTAETIYRRSHYKILVDVFKHALKPNGKIYLNTKSHYYGVGGNLNDFLNYVKEDGTFKCEVTQTSNSGVLRYVVVISFE